ncbi:MAG: Ig-like domain-containing protein [Pirellulaceae bacterium]|nr:Ig-like domain-containing protein [Pirellulaceae bacterium]
MRRTRAPYLGRRQRTRGTINCRPGIERLEDRRLLAASPLGSESRVNQFTPGVQSTLLQSQAVTFVAADQTLVAFTGSGPQDPWGVFAQRIAGDGTRLGDQIRLNQTTLGTQEFASAAALPGGRFVAVWSGYGAGDSYGVFARRLDAQGTPLSHEMLVNTTTLGAQLRPKVAAAPDGRFVVTWFGTGQGDDWGVFARLFDASGSPVGGEIRVAETRRGAQHEPSVAMAADGSFVVTWGGTGIGDPWGVFARRFHATGQPASGEIRVNQDPLPAQIEPSVAITADNGFVVTWTGTGPGDPWGVFASRFHADGSRAGSDSRVNQTTLGDQRWSSVAALPGGGYVVAWTGGGQGDYWGVFVREFAADGTPVSDEVPANTTTIGAQHFASVTTNAMGDYAVAWSGYAPQDPLGVYVRGFQQPRPAIPTAIASLSPGEGESLVNVVRETTVQFSEEIDPATVTSDSFHVMALGQRIPGRVVVSSTNRFAKYFYDSPLPGATAVRIVVNGDQILDAFGQPLDADGDGVPGGVRTADFTTLPLTLIPNTAVTGRVLESNAVDGDGNPVEQPVAGVTIRLEGRPDIQAVTGEDGRFVLTSAQGLPAPDFFVVIDGSTAMGVPDGFMYPTLGKPFHSVPGREVPLRTPNGEPFDIFLPLMNQQDIVALNPSGPTDVGFGPGGLQTLQQLFPDTDPAVWNRTRVNFQPGSAQDDAGNPATQAAIVPVAPDRIPAPLPEFLNPALVISIQAGGTGGFNGAGGATQFDVPAEVEFPNLEGLQPGEQALIFSFDHDAGRWIVVGTGTVSADGLMIESDGGVIQAPGWHFTIRGTQVSTRIGLRNFDGGFGRGKDSEFGQETPALTAEETARDQALLRDFLVDPPLYVGADPPVNIRDDVVLPIYDRFVAGTGGTRTWQDGSALSTLVASSSQFQTLRETIVRQIQETIEAQAGRGYIDPTEIEIAASDLQIFWNKYDIRIPFTLRAVLGGTQGTLVCLSGFQASASAETRQGSYTTDVQVVIFDDFGVGSDDTYSEALNAMYRLQHRGTARPFVNRVEILLPGVMGQFQVPEQYEDVVYDPPSPTTPCTTDAGGGGGEAGVGNHAAAAGSEGEGPVELVRIARSTADGFGADPSVYYAIEPMGQAAVRGKLLSGQSPNDLVLPPDMPVLARFYQPSTNRSLSITTSTDASGRLSYFLEEPLIAPPDGRAPSSEMYLTMLGGLDNDADGIPNVGEIVLGTLVDNGDSDGDGVSDSAELAQGLNPLDGLAAVTGPAASLPLDGAAQALDVAGSYAYVASGNSLLVVDVGQFDRPIANGQLPLPSAGRDVAVDEGRGLVAVSTGLAVQLIDVTDPLLPVLRRTVSAFADRVEMYSGFTYALSGTRLTTIDLDTGEIVGRTDLPGSGNATGMARVADKLFAYVSGSDTLVAIDLAMADAPQVIDELNVGIASSDVGIFAGHGVLWLAGSGLRTVDISDPANMQLIQAPSGNQFFTARRVALNGSGLGLLLPDGGSFVQVYDTTDPGNVANLVTQFNLSAAARDLKISGGIGYIAAGNSLEVVNYRSFDALGQPPLVTITTPVLDLDPDAPGLQVLEGTTIPVVAQVEDDVQAREVHLLVGGQTASRDGSFPFDLTAMAPLLNSGQSSLELQVRAVDTGGNAALSNSLFFVIVADTFAPVIEAVSPPDGTQVLEGRRTLRIRFTESLSEDSVAQGAFTVVGAGADGLFDTADDLAVPLAAELRDDDRLVQLVTDPLQLGDYQLRIREDAVRDRPGNPLGAGTFVSHFTVVETPPIFQGSDPDVLFVIDVSGSTSSSFGGTSVGDLNGDGTSSDILDAQIAALLVLNQELINLGQTERARVGVIVFGSSARALDMDPAAAGEQLAVPPNTDANGDGNRDVDQVLTAIRRGHMGVGTGTSFDAALQAAIATFQQLGTPPGEGNIVFLSDGSGGGAFLDEVATLRDDLGVNIRAFGVGPGASLAQLTQIDPRATRFSSTDQLLDTLLGNEPDAGGPAAAEGEFSPLDVNRDGQVAPGDALQVFNYLNRTRRTPLVIGAGEAQGDDLAPMVHSLDVNGDGVVSPSDALAVVNHLNALDAVLRQTQRHSPTVEADDLLDELGELAGEDGQLK